MAVSEGVSILTTVGFGDAGTSLASRMPVTKLSMWQNASSPGRQGSGTVCDADATLSQLGRVFDVVPGRLVVPQG